MNKWKWSFLATFVLLIGTNIYWLYSAIDTGITHTYLLASYDNKERAVQLLGDLVARGGQEYKKKDVLHILRQLNPDAFIVESDDRIEIDGVHFIFKEGKLVEVRG